MAWPNTRLTTYAPASKVKSNDLNAIQDAIIAGQHGDLTPSIPPTDAIYQTLCAYNVAGYIASTGVSLMIFPLHMLRPGHRLKQIVVSLFGSGGGNNTLAVEKITAAGVLSTLPVVSGTTVVAPGAAWASYTLDLTDYVLAAGEALQFTVSQQNTHRCGSARPTFDRP